MKFFTSDTHIDHKNILKYANRPFSSVDEMNEEIIKRWNSVVGSDDEVYHLGDWGYFDDKRMIYILDRLNGKKHLIRGNHDKHLRTPNFEILKRVEWIKDYYEIRIHGHQHMVLCHYPIYEWHQCHRGSYMLHGHCHGNINEENKDLRRLDVGVDNFNFTPVSYDQIHAILKDRPMFPHHKKVAQERKVE